MVINQLEKCFFISLKVNWLCKLTIGVETIMESQGHSQSDSNLFHQEKPKELQTSNSCSNIKCKKYESPLPMDYEFCPKCGKELTPPADDERYDLKTVQRFIEM